VSALRRRVERLFGQSRIRLPHRRPAAEDLETGDRVQIGAVVWQVRGGLALWSGSWAFLVEALEAGPEVSGAPRTARLLVPISPAAQDWTLVHNGEPRQVPMECMVVFPAGEAVQS
jgi:hypothetical protein